MEGPQPPKPIPSTTAALERLSQAAPGPSRHARLTTLGDRLAQLIARPAAYSATYLSQVIAGKLEPGPPLVLAVQRLTQLRTAVVLPGLPGVQVLESSIRTCQVCFQMFAPNIPTRKRCYACAPPDPRDRRRK